MGSGDRSRRWFSNSCGTSRTTRSTAPALSGGPTPESRWPHESYYLQNETLAIEYESLSDLRCLPRPDHRAAYLRTPERDPRNFVPRVTLAAHRRLSHLRHTQRCVGPQADAPPARQAAITEPFFNSERTEGAPVTAGPMPQQQPDGRERSSLVIRRQLLRLPRLGQPLVAAVPQLVWETFYLLPKHPYHAGRCLTCRVESRRGTTPFRATQKASMPD